MQIKMLAAIAVFSSVLLGVGCSDLIDLNDSLNTMAEAQQRLDDLNARMEADRPKWDAWQEDMERRNKEFWERSKEIDRKLQELRDRLNTNTPNTERSGAERPAGADGSAEEIT